jgi:hypothetical protein
MKTYGTIELTQASPAQIFVEPLALAQAKTFLRIGSVSPADAEEDLQLLGFITAARETAEILQGIDLIPKQYDLSLDILLGQYAVTDPGFIMRAQTSVYDFSDAFEIELRNPLQSIDLFQYRDKDGNYIKLTEDTDYVVDLSRGIVKPPYGKTWPLFDPSPSCSIVIRFTAGYPLGHPFWSNAGQRLIVGMKMLIEQWYDERLPFVVGHVQELPFAVSALLGYGAKNRVY